MQRIIVLLSVSIGFVQSLSAGALEDYKQACMNDDAKGCYQVGAAYRDGLGVRQDAEAAKGYFKMACDMGEARACGELKDADQHRNDSGIGASDTEQDNKIVVLGKACAHDDRESCFDLGLLYEDKRGNYTKAAEYYKKVCDLGDGLGCVYLGVLIEEGKGYVRSYIKAAEYYKKGCDFGESVGCSILGFLYEKGKGFEQNYIKAEKYYKKACDLGDKDGCEKYRKMRSD